MKPTFNNFFDASRESLYRTAIHLSRNRDEAKDLMQETVYRALRSWDRCDHSKPTKPWAITIMHNKHRDSLRRYERTHTVSLDCPLDGADGVTFGELLADSKQDPAEIAEHAETVALARSALESLEPHHRAVLELSEIESLSYDDIAESLGIAVGTVRSRISRGRKQFKKALDNV